MRRCVSITKGCVFVIDYIDNNSLVLVFLFDMANSTLIYYEGTLPLII